MRPSFDIGRRRPKLDYAHDLGIGNRRRCEEGCAWLRMPGWRGCPANNAEIAFRYKLGRGVKFGRANREKANEAIAIIVERMQREFRLSDDETDLTTKDRSRGKQRGRMQSK